MIRVLLLLVALLRLALKSRRALALENLALRQPLAVLKRNQPRPRLRQTDRWFWGWLSRLWSHWQRALMIVKPETVVRWHRKGFRLFWMGMSQSRPLRRPAVGSEIRDFIRRMAEANPFWGAPRIHGE
jgi:hypothetical protein